MEDKDNDSGEEKSISFDFSKIRKMFKGGFFSSKLTKILLITLLVLIPVILTIYVRTLPQYLPATESWAENSVYNYYRNGIVQQVNAQYPNLPQAQRDTLINQQFEQFKAANMADLDASVKQTSDYFKTGFRYTENGKEWTFLGDLDSYTYLRYARNIEQKGMVCDELRDGKCIDNKMLAPLGFETGPSMHSYGIFYLHSFIKIFDKNTTLMHAAFLLPTVLAVIAAIAAFFIGRRLMNETAGFFAAMFIATSPLFISRTLGSDTDVWNVMFPLVILWIFLEAYESKSNIKRYILAGAAGLALGVFSFAWGGWWYIFDFIIVAVIGYIGFELVKNYLQHKSFKKLFNKELSHSLLMLGILFISTMVFVSIFTSFTTFKGVVEAPFFYLSTLKVATHSDLWPNVYTTVAELNEANIATVIGQTSFGMNLLFALGLLGIIFTLVKRKPDMKEYILIIASFLMFIYLTSASGQALNTNLFLALLLLPVILALILVLLDKNSKIDIKVALLLAVWYVGMIFASLKGIRFIMLLVPAFSVAMGVTVGYIHQYIVRMGKDHFKMNESWTKIGAFILLCLILITPVNMAIATGESYVPSITKGWWDGLTKIREESKPDAIINSWWDFGHWFKYVADRRVTLDGASQNHPNAHWLGKALQSNNEKESVAILRMLDCGSNTLFQKINEKYNDTERAHNVVKEIIMMDKDDAIEYLENIGFNNAQDIVKYSHCTPPENYFITSGDMVGKAGVWAHFGLWDFDRAFIISEVRPKSLSEGTAILKERFNYTDNEATRIYYEVQSLQTDRETNDWIAPWPSYAGNTIGCQNVSDTVICNVGMGIGNNGQTITVIDRAIVNLTSPENSDLIIAFYDQSGRKLQETKGSFSELAIVDNTTRKYKSNNATISLGMALFVNRDEAQPTYTALISDPLLVDSTFTKLFFLNGQNTEYFDKFYDTTDITGTRIIIWKVNWDKFLSEND